MLKVILFILAIPLIILLGMFVLIGFMGHGYERIDLGGKAPFTGLIGSSVTLKRSAILAKNNKNFVKQNRYLFTLNAQEIGPDLPRYSLPAGTTLNITSVEHFRQKMNGYRSIEVLGTVQIPNTTKTVKFEYSWGLENMVPVFEGKPREWTFPLAPWQETAHTNIYYFDIE